MNARHHIVTEPGQFEFFEYFRVRQLDIAERDWLCRMEAAFVHRGFLSDRQVAVLERIARQHGVDVGEAPPFTIASAG